MEYAKIRLEPFLDGQAMRLVLNAPPGNVLDGTMLAEIHDALEGLKRQADLKLLCFAGEGKHFSFGASVEEHVGEKARGMRKAFRGMFERLVELSVPMAAAVKGRCLGGGMELAAFCQRVVAHPSAVFAQQEIQLAVFPPVASLLLPFRVGQSRADELILTGRNVEAAEAKALGLADGLADYPLVAIEEWAHRELVPKSASSLRMAVRASRWAVNKVLREELPRLEALYLDELMKTHDAAEGLEAFLQKRPPTWRNG